MAPVVHALATLPPADVESIALYFADMDHADERAASSGPAVVRAMAYAPLGTGQESDPDARLYMAACASCHYNAGAPLALRPDLALNNALNLADPSNFIQVVLHGIDAEDGIPGVVMPSFGQALSDRDIARIGDYLRRTRTDASPWAHLVQQIAALRAKTQATEP
jgi:cytochrome c553